MILAVSIINRNLIGFLVDNISLCNALYSYMMDLISIKQVDMNMYYREYLLAFNDFITYPQGIMDVIVTVGKGACGIRVILNFLKILC